ncbi:hypothetical protein M0804_012245 [Polistes exclamans]|nr:hypothetical protein M0804_012245 [Polistes exclamans]
MLCTWMKNNNNNNWNEGLGFVQFIKNKTYHSGIKKSPYEALFGIKPKIGLTSSLPKEIEILQDIRTEEELEKIIETFKQQK